MKIIRLNKVDSTHTYLREYVNNNEINEITCIVADIQTNGIGSRGNTWQGKSGNLFFSFVMKKDTLPNDLPLQTTSIYFSFLLKKVLEKFDSKVWLKWPNDFYIDDKKIGGTITNLSKDLIFCGIGLNLFEVTDEFGKLDISIDKETILENYFLELEKQISWKQIFSDFKIEFDKSRKFQATIDNKKIPLKNAILNSDGSINLNNKKVFSLR
ncbi:biotin--[acetyl-CoA-carboxylase] ligase [Arcobacter sp. YIC-464]|uniref:biotin--[acetyl-CoA-carboxylase] ligase n=1 Tax=Arcobacter sp. YIC-464 TaxID=3376631 RepID=UPI003C26B564